MSVRDQCSKAEWDARVELAACGRLLDYYGLTEMTNNHISTRVPGEKNHILVNSHYYFFEEITASNILKIDLDGNVITGPKEELSNAAYVLHSGLYKARKDINAVAHTHTNPGMATSTNQCGLLPIFQNSFDFYQMVAYHEYAGSASEFEDTAVVVNDLGPHKAMIMHNHGLLTVGGEVSEAFSLMYRLDKCCRAQNMALATGAEIHEVSPEIKEKTHMYKVNRGNFGGRRSWPGHLRRLEKLDPSYKH